MIFKCQALLLSVLLAAALLSCKYNSHQGEVYCEVRPLQTTAGNWGYEIYVDKKLYIKQEFIPVISGVHPFKSKDDAMKTGKVVLDKLLHGKRPALTLDDLKDLQIVQ